MIDLEPSVLCLSEDLKTTRDAKEGKWVLYHREVDKEIPSFTTPKDAYELTIDARPNKGTH